MSKWFPDIVTFATLLTKVFPKKLFLKNVTLKFEVDMLEKWEFLAGSSGGQFGGEILQGLFLLQKSKLPGRQITREPKHYPTC